MKAQLSLIAISGLLSLVSAAALDKRTCFEGSYAVKIENHVSSDCQDGAFGASIANYGEAGNCIDTLNGHNFLYLFNDGCVLSSIDLHCYDTADECNADIHGSGGNVMGSSLTNGLCTIAPPNCPFVRAVAGSG